MYFSVLCCAAATAAAAVTTTTTNTAAIANTTTTTTIIITTTTTTIGNKIVIIVISTVSIMSDSIFSMICVGTSEEWTIRFRVTFLHHFLDDLLFKQSYQDGGGGWVGHVARNGDNRRAYRVSVKRNLWERDRFENLG